MKKLLCLLSASLLVLTSCSNEDSTPTTPPAILLKRTVETDDLGATITTNYTYNGNKLVSIIDNTGDAGMYFTYTGDLITKLEFKLLDGTVEQTNLYEYDLNNNLVTFKRLEPIDDLGYKETYVYNTDGSISTSNYSGDIISQTLLGGTGTILFSNGEVSQIGSTNSPTFTYTYDNKNNPMKNVLGWDKTSFTDGEASGILHNIISENGVMFDSATFNADNYPVSETGTDEFGSPYTTQLFYE